MAINGFWKKLNKPFFALAPMADVTDMEMREMVAKYGKPDILWTEFVSCDGLLSRGKEKLLPDLWYSENQRPIVAQLFSSKPENFYKCAALIKQMGFDGLDINMGCPDKSVEKQGAGAALMKDPKLAQKIVLEAKRGAGTMPVSVKTRIGYNSNELKTWLPALLKTEPSAITIHVRTRKEMSKVPAQWELFPEIMDVVNKFTTKKTRPMIIGNGDVFSVGDAKEKAKKYGLDGIMIGRGIFGNPWLFSEIDWGNLPVREKLKVALEHTKLFEKIFGETKENKKIFGKRARNFALMKKHYKAYINGFEGAKELRVKLMGTNSVEEVEKIIAKEVKRLEK